MKSVEELEDELDLREPTVDEMEDEVGEHGSEEDDE